MMLRFGVKVRTLRKQRRLTLRDVAHVLGVHYTHVQKIEAGRKRPSSDLILKFATLFGVSADQLMRDDLDIEMGGRTEQT
jgi:transcriptional regulator with XRE-family HTH domain